MHAGVTWVSGFDHHPGSLISSASTILLIWYGTRILLVDLSLCRLRLTCSGFQSGRCSLVARPVTLALFPPPPVACMARFLRMLGVDRLLWVILTSALTLLDGLHCVFLVGMAHCSLAGLPGLTPGATLPKPAGDMGRTSLPGNSSYCACF